MPSPYPQTAPTVSGNNVTVSAFLANPPRVQRAIENLAAQRFIADVIFTAGPAATGGSVIYDQVLGQGNIFTERDVQEIEAGSEFPILNTGETAPLVAVARKWGGEVLLTDEAVRRDNRDLLAREMTRLRNTIVRKVDTVAMATLRAAPVNTLAATGDWSTTAGAVITDVARASNAVSSLDLGYEVDVAFVNPAQELDMLLDEKVRTALPRESTTVPIATGKLGRFMGIDFVVTNRVDPGEVIFVTRGMTGGISDEVPLYARPIRDERRESTFIHGARVAVPYVTDPKSVVRLTGA